MISGVISMRRMPPGKPPTRETDDRVIMAVRTAQPDIVPGVQDFTGRSRSRVAAISFRVPPIYGAILWTLPNILDWTDGANSRFTPYDFAIVTYTKLDLPEVRSANLAGEIIARLGGLLVRCAESRG